MSRAFTPAFRMWILSCMTRPIWATSPTVSTPSMMMTTTSSPPSCWGEAQGSVANYAYILSGAKSEEKIDSTYYWEFDAVVGGEIVTLTAQSKYDRTIDDLQPGTFRSCATPASMSLPLRTSRLTTSTADNTKNIVDEEVYGRWSRCRLRWPC